MVELVIVLGLAFGLSAVALGKAWRHGADCERQIGRCEDERGGY